MGNGSVDGMWTTYPVFVTEGVRALDETGRERPSCPVSSDAITPLLSGDVFEVGFVRALRPAAACSKKLRLRLASEKRFENGRDLLRLIPEALRRHDGVAELKRLYLTFPSVAPRVSAVHDFLDRVRKTSVGSDLAFFLGRFAPQRGRPTTWIMDIQLICWMEELVNEGMSAAEAAAELKQKWPEAQHIANSRTLEVKRSRYREHARIFAEGYYVPARSLRPEPWGGFRHSWRCIA